MELLLLLLAAAGCLLPAVQAYSAYHIEHQDGEILFDINTSAGRDLQISAADGTVEYPGGEKGTVIITATFRDLASLVSPSSEINVFRIPEYKTTNLLGNKHKTYNLEWRVQKFSGNLEFEFILTPDSGGSAIDKDLGYAAGNTYTLVGTVGSIGFNTNCGPAIGNQVISLDAGINSVELGKILFDANPNTALWETLRIESISSALAMDSNTCATITLPPFRN